MTTIAKPDMTKAWANSGAIIQPDNASIDLGWVAEKPPHQHENWIQNRSDKYMQHLDERGVPEYDAQVIYSKQSLCYFSEQVWVSLINSNLNNSPIAGSGNWIPQSELQNPVGLVSAYAGAGAPAGWFVCNGQAVSRTTYARLFSFLGTTYGVGNGSTTFNLPNLVGKTPVGIGGSGITVLGGTIGAQNVTLAIANLPSHNHTFSGNALAAHSHLEYYNGLDGGSLGTFMSGTAFSATRNPSAIQTGSTSGGTPSGTISQTGSGSAINNMQPSLGLNWIIKF